MSHCRCQTPRLNHRRTDYCGRCGVQLDRKWLSSDENLAAFHIEVARLPGVPSGILIDSHRRQHAGRVEFGLKYLGRDNEDEALEEFSDGLNYSFFAWLNDRRAGIEGIDPDLLDAAHHSALAFAAIERRKRRLGK